MYVVISLDEIYFSFPVISTQLFSKDNNVEIKVISLVAKTIDQAFHQSSFSFLFLLRKPFSVRLNVLETLAKTSIMQKLHHS